MGALSGKQKVAWIAITVAVLVYALFPVLSILATSFKLPSELNLNTFLPVHWTWTNYEQILGPDGSARDLFLPSLRNSIGISLIATAIGLFAAIPAVIGYNRYTHDVDRLATRYETFIEEFSNILQRQG